VDDAVFLYQDHDGADFPFEEAPGTGLHDWRDVYPQLRVVDEARDEIFAEVSSSAAVSWFGWPQHHLWKRDGQRWDVLPFLGFGHKLVANLERFPRLSRVLAGIPGLRTAIFSRVGPRTRIAPHRGPFLLSSQILRCHYGIAAPPEGGVSIGGVRVQQRVGEWIVFDDVRMHYGFNEAPAGDKIVLLLDLKRPDHLRPSSWPRYPFPTQMPPGWESVLEGDSPVERFDPERL